MAGSKILSSSSPKSPPSDACGFSAQTAILGSSIPQPARKVRRKELDLIHE